MIRPGPTDQLALSAINLSRIARPSAFTGFTRDIAFFFQHLRKGLEFGGKIDDVVGAIPVHLFAGIWGTIAVVLTNGDASLGTQLYSIVVVGIFVFVVSGVVWFILKAVMGIRVSEEAEINGLDTSELGMEAYPDFSKG